MKIKAITPLGKFESIDLTERELLEVTSVLRQSNTVASIEFCISKEKKTTIFLPCETIKNSVFVIDHRD